MKTRYSKSRAGSSVRALLLTLTVTGVLLLPVIGHFLMTNPGGVI